MAAKIINFELLYLNKKDYSFDELMRVTKQKILNEIKEAIASEHDTIIGLLLLDGFLYKNNNESLGFLYDIENRAKELGIKKLILIPGMCDLKFDIETMYFDYTHRVVFNGYKDKTLSAWHHSAERFLFLGGQPARPNRIGLLKKFYDLSLLDSAEWSFFPPWEENDKRDCRNLLSDVPDEEYELFLKRCARSIDKKYDNAKNYAKVKGQDLLKESLDQSEWLKDPAYIDSKIYNSTSFSVISEGNAWPPATDFRFLTEKFWRAVANKHPFIFSGYIEQYQYIKELGLKTFEEYLPIPDYGFIENEEDRLNAVVKNTEGFLKNYKNFVDQIQKDVDHNYDIFIKISESQKTFIDSLKRDYGVSDKDLDFWFNQKGFSHLIEVADASS
jgi:hypothetical protein